MFIKNAISIAMNGEVAGLPSRPWSLNIRSNMEMRGGYMRIPSSHFPVAHLTALLIACCGGSAIAADMAVPRKAPIALPPAIETWSFRLTPYVWMTSINGSTTVKGRTSDVSASFTDILDHTEFPKDLFQVAAFGEARYGRWAFLADLAYLKMGINSNFMHSRGVDNIGHSVGVAAGLTTEMFIAEFAAAYELGRWNGLTSAASSTSLDIYAGGRAWWQRADLNLSATGTANIGDLSLNRDGTLTASGNVSWVDPVVGLRLQHEFAPKVDLVLSGDVGGFGVGSRFSWQAIAGLSYDFARTNSILWSGMIGYKALYADYEQGAGNTAYAYKVTLHGPVIGISARF